MRAHVIRRFGLIGVLVVASSSSSFSSARAAEPAEGFVLPDGLEAKAWARTPQLYNPTNIDVDARGRVWVAEGVNYRESIKRQNALKHPEGDRIVILEDADGDGRAERSKVFVQDRDLVCPLGVAVIGERVIVSCSPHVIVYTDRDGDDKPDEKKIFLTGFGGYDHDHGVHAFTGHLDGRWYFNVGNAGPHKVTDAGGWTLHSGSVYDDRNTGNTGNRKSDDGRVWVGGLALRVDPDGKNLRPLAHGFRNSYEIPIDSFGNLWQSDNDDDGNQACRLAWVMEGGNYGFFSADGTRSWQADRRPGQNTQAAHWHAEDPGVAPPGEITGAGGPTGVAVYEGGSLPEKYLGAVLACDTGRNRVSIYMPKASGAGFAFERSDLIASKLGDDAAGAEGRMFRPSDVVIGTDGAVYVADWYDPVTGGHNIQDKQGGGRILRIAPKGDQTKPPKIGFSTTDGQLAALNNPAINIRHVAANKLAEKRDSQVIERLQTMAAGTNAIERARATWVLSRCGDAGAKAVEQMLSSGNEATRLVAVRALRSAGDRWLDHATQLAGDPSPAIRREVAVALRDVPLEKCQEALVKLAENYDGKDRYYLEALGLACDGKEETIYPVLLKKLGGNDPLKWSEAMTNIAWRLHPKAAIDAFAARATSTDVSDVGRKQAIVAIAFVNDEHAAAAMANVARRGPEDIHPLAEWWIANRLTNDWKDYAAARHYGSDATAANKADPKADAKLEEDRNLLLDENANKRNRERAAGRLAGGPEGAKFILALAAEGKFPKDFNGAVTDRLHKSTDLSIRALASQYFPRQAAGGTPLPPIKELASMKGDGSRGRAVFFGNTAACAKCHRFAGEGKDVGPDLTAIRAKYGRPELLDSILNPSAGIAFGYEAWIVKTKQNDVYSGFILADADNVVLKESSGEQRTIPAKEIVLRKKQAISVMPDNVALGLNARELADLAEFLMTAPQQQAQKP